MTFGVIARELGRRGHEVTVYRPRRRDIPPLPHPDYRQVPMPGVPIPGYPLLRLGLPARRRLRRTWSERRPDLVHVATEGPLGASAVSAARGAGIPVTSSFHTNFHLYTRHYGMAPLRGAALGWLRWVHNRTRLTFAPTKALCSELEADGFKNVRVLSRGVDTGQFSPGLRSQALREHWGAAQGDPVVLHAGRMAPEKNYALLFRAFRAMSQANPRCRFVLVGDGPVRRGLEREMPEGIFTGFVPPEELARAYASADVYVHASLSETFGNVLTEAMASGLAVAAFDYAAAATFVKNEDNGLSVPCADPDALVAAAVRLALDAGLRERLGVAAAAAVRGYSWDRVVSGFEADLLSAVRGADGDSSAQARRGEG